MSRELTARQRQVLTHVANGRTNAQIGHHLSLSPFTIGRHLAEAFRTLGAKDRANAVAIALATGELGVQQIRIPDQQREPAT